MTLNKLQPIHITSLVLMVFGLLWPASLSAQGNYVFTNVDYPGAMLTSPQAVNDSAKVVGWWDDSGGNLHGFYWNGTTYTSIDYPGADSTEALGINNAGVISGLYLTNQGTQAHGFTLTNGTFTSYDYPGYEGQTDGQGINNNGELTGYYDFGPTYGFYDTHGGFSSYGYPGADSTYPHALNDSGKSAGYYRVGCCSSPIGFYYDGSAFTDIEYPDGWQTFAAGINNAGVVVGYSSLNDAPYEAGFLWQAGQFTLINSNATPAPSGINNNGQIVGAYYPNGVYHGFLATPGTPAQPLQFVPILPCRVVDTRNSNGQFGGPPITGGSFRSFPIPQGLCFVPSTAAAYSLNVTLVPIHHPVGYLTIWPTGQTQPTVSTMNSLDGRIKANAAIVPAGTNAAVSVYVTDTTNVVLDIDGYFIPRDHGHAGFPPADALPRGRHTQEQLPARPGHAASVGRYGSRLPGTG